MSSKFLVIIIGSLGFFLACGSGSVSNQRQDALLEGDAEEEITAERPTVIAGSHLACSDKISAQGFKKVICRISDEVDLDNLNLKYLSIRVNERQIPISVSSERDFEIVVAEEEEIDSSAMIIVDEEPSSNPQSADQKAEKEEKEEDSSVVDEVIDSDDSPADGGSNAENENDGQMSSEEDQTTPPEVPMISDIPTVDLKKGLADDGEMNVVSFDKNNKVLSSIEDFDDEFETNTFELKNIDKKDDDILRELSKLVTFRIELHNSQLSKGAVLKINDMVFGDSHIPNPQQLYSTAASGLSEIKTLDSFMIAVSPDASKDETLWASNDKCVEDNKEGPDGAIRGGALTVKIFDDEDELFWELSVYADGGDCDEDGKGKR